MTITLERPTEATVPDLDAVFRADQREMQSRFYAQVDSCSGMCDCYLWAGTPTFEACGQEMDPAVFAYRTAGGLLPFGYVLARTCGEPLCVNPGHLRPTPRRVG